RGGGGGGGHHGGGMRGGMHGGMGGMHGGMHGGRPPHRRGCSGCGCFPFGMMSIFAISAVVFGLFQLFV
ncbi:MAG: hypothetical protein R3Y06_08075, partial [Faecalibacterium sp.]